MNRTLLGLAPLALVVATLTPGCGGDDTASTSLAETSGDGDGDGDATTTNGDGDGDGDGSPGDGDGDPTTPPPDTDMDGTPDADDNCPDVANPNQLDYDGNGMGNACDTQMFTATGGSLMTTVNVNAGLGGNCSIPVTIDITGGNVLVQLDDDAAVAAFQIDALNVADILDKQCNLIVNATVSMTNFVISNSGGDFPVSMPHSLAMHNGGQIAGMSDGPHPVLSTATLSTSINGGDPMPSDLMLEDGNLPIFTANITGGGMSGTMSWMDPNFIVAMTTFMVTDPVALDIEVQLEGLVGSVMLAP